MTDAKIIQLKPGERKPVDIKRQNFIDGCRHRNHTAVVDKELRIVECENCGAILDPIEVLIELAVRYREVDYKLDQMRKYEEKLEQQRKRRRKK